MTKGDGNAWMSEVKSFRRRPVGRRADCEKTSGVNDKRSFGACRYPSENGGVFVTTDKRRAKSLLPELHSPCTYLPKMNPALSSCAGAVATAALSDITLLILSHYAG